MNNQIFWSEEEITKLINKYEISSRDELSKIFPNRNYRSITMKANKLGLKKSQAVRSAHIAKRNKMVGRDLTFEKLQEIALRYKTRGEFQHKDNSAYVVARTHKWLDKICSHMFAQKYSTPQIILNLIIKKLLNTPTLYNDRKIIKPLELDIFVPEFNIAFEYDGKHWHKNKTNDRKIKLCESNNIKLFVIKENNRNYEADIKTQLIDMKDQIGEFCNKKIFEQDILEIIIDYEKVIIDKRDITEICNKYESFTLFKKENNSLYEKLIKLKLLNHFTSNMKRDRQIWTIDKAKLLLVQYEYIHILVKENWGLYQWCRRNYPDLLIPLKSLKNKLS
jgi:hypothetical protein